MKTSSCRIYKILTKNQLNYALRLVEAYRHHNSSMAAVNVRMNPFGVVGAFFVIICLWWYLFGLPLSIREEQRVSMKELLTVSIELAKRGGDSVYAIRTGGSLGQKVKGKTAEGAKEMLTQGDLESHRAIMYGMLKAFPGLRVSMLALLRCEHNR